MMPRLSASDWKRLAAIVWGIALLVVCLRSCLTPDRNNVLPIYTLAGENWTTGKPVYGNVSQELDVFRYSPPVAGFFSVLRMLPPSSANILWRLINAAVFFWGFAWWLKEVNAGKLSASQRSLLFLLVLPLSLPCLNNGQINPLLLGLMLAGIAAFRREQFLGAAILVGLSCWIKVYPISLGLLLCVVNPRRFTLPWLFALTAIAGISFLFRSPGYVLCQYSCWLDQVIIDSQELGQAGTQQINLSLLCEVLRIPLPGFGYLAIQLIVAAAIALWCFLGGRKLPANGLLYFLTAFCFCWMTIFGPAVESATWILLSPPLVAGFFHRYMGNRSLLIAAYLLLCLTNIAKWFPWGRLPTELGFHPIAGLLFFTTLVFSGISLLIYQRKDGSIPWQLPPHLHKQTFNRQAETEYSSITGVVR